MIVDNDFNKWNINKLPRQKGAQGNYGGAVYVGRDNQNVINNTGIQGHYLWGNYFDATQDINGDINTQGDVNFYGNLNYQGEYDPNDDLHGNLYIGRVNAEDGNFKELKSDILKAAEAYIENLTVTGTAHFFELIIDKIKSTGGSIMLTPADGFELWGFNTRVQGGTAHILVDLWWVAKDTKNDKYNTWQVGDQALCKNFDAAKVGISSNVSNKNWWAKVVNVYDTPWWCYKSYSDERNPDMISHPNDYSYESNNTFYENVHSTLRTTDFVKSDKFVYVYIVEENGVYHRDRWITNEEYFNLSTSDKQDYEYSPIYVHTNEDGTTIEISEFQYENRSISETDILVYDEIARAGKVLRSYCKADCKPCFGITIDTSIKKNNSVFYKTETVTNDGITVNKSAWVFQEGDNIVMLGNQENEGRQNAIYLCSGSQGSQGTGTYGSLDTDLRPPFIAQYKGIGSKKSGETEQDRFNLEKRKFTWFSGGWVGAQGFANQIQGNLKITTGQSVTEYVDDEVARGMQGIQGTYVTQADFTVAMDGIQGTVTRGFQGMQGEISGVQSQIDQQADRITLQVTNNVGTELKTRTGIDISDGTITLDAQKTTITGELNFGNQNSGMVLYDDKGTPIIRISNDEIGNFADFNDTIGYSKSINGEVNQSSWNITTSTEKIGSWGIGDNIAINHFGICEYVENNGQFIYPSSNTCDMDIDLILNGNVVETISVTGVTKNAAGYYIYNGTKTFTSLSSGGAYSLRIRTSGLGTSSGNRIIYNFIYKYDYSNNKLVRLADGGFSSNPAPNSYIWSNSEMQIMRQGNNAIRVYNPNGEGDSRGLQVLGDTTRGDRWYNYSNYMPTKSLQGSDFITGTAYMGDGGHEDNVKIYEVELGYGRILIPSRNALFGSGNYSGNVYIKLPPINSLCVGWHVNICTIGDIKGDALRVIDGENNSNVQYYVMDGNTNMNSYFKYTIQPYNPDFIYIGYYNDTVDNLGFHWRATTDC